MLNNIKATGFLKNITVRNTATGPIITANLTQREQLSEDKSRCTFTIPVVLFVHGASDARKEFLLGLDQTRAEDSPYTAEVMIEGSLDTLFDRRPSTVSDRRAPQTRIAIDSIALAN